MSDPILPYPDGQTGRSSGWSGSETSAERAHSDDASGVTAKRQARALALLEASGDHGLTWDELARSVAWHHGQASGVLSVLHKTGRIDRLAERRGRSAVYVTPEFVFGRETRPHGRRKPDPQPVPPEVRVAVALLDNWLELHPEHPLVVSHFKVIKSYVEEQ